MKYFFVSDIHGQYDKLIDALDAAQFDCNKDTLVVLGDSFDRGPQSLEVLDFILNCPNKILVWGNHDIRLKKLMMGYSESYYDYHNGVLQTIQSFIQNAAIPSIHLGIQILTSDERFKDVVNKLYSYFNQCVWVIKWEDLYATHALLPSYESLEEITTMEWGDLVWGNTEVFYSSKEYLMFDKPIIVGHWHAWRFRKDPNDMSTFISGDKLFIAIDGCSNAKNGCVNVYIHESEKAPMVLKNQNFTFL